MGDDVFKELQIGGHTPDAELAQGAVHAADGDVGLGGPRGDLHQQRVVVRRDHGIGIHRAAVESYAEAGRAAVGGDAAVVGGEAVLGVFGGHPALQGVAGEAQVVLFRQALVANARTFADADLRGHQIDAGDHLGDGVLDLDARIDLDEVEAAGVGIHQKFHRSGVAVAHAGAEAQGGCAEALALCLREIGRGRALHHFLVAALHRAVALEEMHQIAVRVAQHLHLHMAGALHQLFDIDRVVAEGGE